jgi:hypothetical protein
MGELLDSMKKVVAKLGARDDVAGERRSRNSA